MGRTVKIMNNEGRGPYHIEIQLDTPMADEGPYYIYDLSDSSMEERELGGYVTLCGVTPFKPVASAPSRAEAEEIAKEQAFFAYFTG